MNSFLVSPIDIQSDRLTLRNEEAHHCIRVLRMHEGEALMAINGEGTAFHSRIVSIAPRAVECVIEERFPELNEPARKIFLGLSLLKHSAKFDIVVEKAVELGVAGIIPLHAEHTERQRGKVERWREITISATKQSLRCRIPLIVEPCSVAEACASQPFGAIAIAHERTAVTESFTKFLASHRESDSLLILIGPEGGFTEAECLAVEHAGGSRVSLGTRRLRSETAAIVSVGLAGAFFEL